MAGKDNSNNKEKEKADRRRRRFWDACQLLLSAWLCNKFNYSFDESFEPADIDGPVLVAVNHASAYDPLFVCKAFRKKRLTFIASEHILRGKWGPFLDKHISFIPHQKGARGSRTALVAMKRIKKGESIRRHACDISAGRSLFVGAALGVKPAQGKSLWPAGRSLQSGNS